MARVTVIGGGLAGLVASISCAEQGARVHLFEAHRSLGGRARTTDGPYHANLGPHVLYSDGPTWPWLAARGLLPPCSKAPVTGVRFRHQGEIRRTPPLGFVAHLVLLRRRSAPVESDFRGWAAGQVGEPAAGTLASAAGVFCFDHDPGRLSARFVWERLVRVTRPPSAARYPHGGWGALIELLAARARALGVRLETGSPVDTLPEPPVIVATELAAARRLLADDGVCWEGGRVVLRDVGLRRRRGDPFIVSDLDEAGWAERFSAPDPSLAPRGLELVQAQLGPRPGEPIDRASARLDALLDAAYPDWRGRATWGRRLVVEACSGALDPPGATWRDRPAVDRGGGVYLAGDMVAAPGLLSEVAFNSALAAARQALAWRPGARPTGQATVADA